MKPITKSTKTAQNTKLKADSSVVTPAEAPESKTEKKFLTPHVPERGEVISEVWTITPENAIHLLEQYSGKNRRPGPKDIERYVRDMKAGNWKMNGLPLIFDTEGKLLNGQHRLMACIQAEVPFSTLVVTGIDRETFDTMDTGRNRDLSQVIEIGGFLGGEDERHTKEVATVVRLLYQYETFGGAHLKAGSPSRTAAIELLRREQDDILEAIAATRRAKKLVTPSTAAFCYVLFVRQDEEKAKAFFDELFTGFRGDEEVTEGPVALLRNTLATNVTTRRKLQTMDIVAAFFLAWKAYRDEVPIKALVRRPDAPFPDINQVAKTRTAAA